MKIKGVLNSSILLTDSDKNNIKSLCDNDDCNYITDTIYRFDILSDLSKEKIFPNHSESLILFGKLHKKVIQEIGIYENKDENNR